MADKTYEACLTKRTMDELADLLYRLGVEPEGPRPRKAELVARAAREIPERLDLAVMALRMEEVAVLRMHTSLSGLGQGDIVISLGAVNRDEDLEWGLRTLRRFGLAWREQSCWRVRRCVRKMLQDAVDVELRFADLLEELMDGLLLHLGMLPEEQLFRCLLDMLGTGKQEEDEVIRSLAGLVLMVRFGLDALYPGEDGEAWVVCPLVFGEDELYERLQEPSIARLPYPRFQVEDLLHAQRDVHMPGMGNEYIPMLRWLHGHGLSGEEAAGLLERLVMLIQNDVFRMATDELMDSVDIRSNRDVDEAMALLTELHNSIPLWMNKGRSAKEMVALLRRKDNASAMPGRNDPCTCGSGKKYKQCCGKRLQ